MSTSSAQSGTRKFVLFLYPVPANLTWQYVKDNIRAVAPTVNRVEVPRDSPNLKNHAWLALKGWDDADMLYRRLTENSFLGQRSVVHMFETTNSPPRFLKSNCQPEICSCCYEILLSSYSRDSVSWPEGNNASTLQFSHSPPTYSSAAPRPLSFPAVNASRGARLTEFTAVFISNLSHEVTNAELESKMRTVGNPISITQGSNGKKTHAVVQFGSAAEAGKAIEKFNGTELKGWTLRIRHDRNQDSPVGAPPSKAKGGRPSDPLVVNGSNE